jgi:hypothetical protein
MQVIVAHFLWPYVKSLIWKKNLWIKIANLNKNIY